MDAVQPSAQLVANLAQVKHKILVLSGKGGVGKSTVSVQLAMALARAGNRVGLLDIDLTGPSIPRLVGAASASVTQTAAGWTPVRVSDADGSTLHVMSIGFLLPSPDAPVVWRGPKKTAVIRQFLEDVQWGALDYLVIDTPPGTSDEHISVLQYLAASNPDGCVIVTTPQAVSTNDVRREISFAQRVQLPVLGVVENMSGFVCPCCEERTNVFSSGGGAGLAAELGLRLIATIPLDPRVSASGDQGSLSSLAAITGASVMAELESWTRELSKPSTSAV